MTRYFGICLLLVASCGGKLGMTDDPSSDAAALPSPTASVTDASGPDAARAADTCHTLMQQAPVVYETSAQTGVPPSTGGTIVDGIYVLTSYVVYKGNAGSGAAVDRVTLEVKGSTLDMVDTSDAGETRATFTFSMANDLLQLMPTCVFGGMGDTFGNTPGFRYSATATELIEFEGGRNVLRSTRTYTRQ